MEFDYGIIGGGPAGYTAGFMLAKQGYKIVLFEKDKIGGTCLNRGCIPTKAMLHLSEAYSQVLSSADLGMEIDVKSFDFAKIAQKRDMIVERLRKSLELAVKNSGITVVYAEASVADKNTIIAAGEEYRVGHIILAEGAKPKDLKGLERDGEFILNSDDILKLDKLPKTVLIVGSGAIGIEWTRIFSNFNVEVTVVEYAPNLLPAADIEVSKRVERIFRQKKIKFYTNDCIETLENKKATLKSGAVIEPEIILSAVGRSPVKTSDKAEAVIGDACGEIQLAHYAIHQAQKLACGIDYDKTLIPSVIYGEPEIAWAGLREQDCGEDCQKVVLPVAALGKSWCDDSTDGFIKLIVSEDKIVGAHIVSKEASALIHELIIAMQNGVGVSDLKKVCFAHPTYSEGIFEAILRL